MISDFVLSGVRNVPYFSEVPEEALIKLAGTALKKTYPKNTVVINEGDEGGALFIVLSGKVEVFLSNESGKSVTLAVQESGSFFGELALLDGQPRSASVVTLEPTICVLIPRPAFQVWLREHPSVSLHIIDSLTRRIRVLTDNVRGLALLDVYGRLIKSLQNLAVREENIYVISPKPSHQELANRVGCSREMISRIMKDLARGGYIATDGKTMRLLRKLPSSW